MNFLLTEEDFLRRLDYTKEFRFELNSFVNSHRATTFALQSEYKSKLGAKFTSWYGKNLVKITNDEFSKILKELRNINQKEGNIYPTFEYKAEVEGGIFYFEVDFTNSQNPIQRERFETKERIAVRISDLLPGEIPGILKKEDEIKIWDSFTNIYMEQRKLLSQVKPNDYKLHQLKIDRFDKNYSPNEFISNLERMGKNLQEVIDDGWKELTTGKPQMPS